MQSAKAQAEVKRLQDAGRKVDAVKVGDQDYVVTRGLETPSPPWGSPLQDILFAVPAAYDVGAALDAFYIKLPYTFNGGAHSKVSGGEIQFENATWKLVSWHYSDSKPFQAGVDGIEGHIYHCRGFFLHRGATNARD